MFPWSWKCAFIDDHWLFFISACFFAFFSFIIVLSEKKKIFFLSSFSFSRLNEEQKKKEQMKRKKNDLRSLYVIKVTMQNVLKQRKRTNQIFVESIDWKCQMFISCTCIGYLQIIVSDYEYLLLWIYLAPCIKKITGAKTLFCIYYNASCNANILQLANTEKIIKEKTRSILSLLKM